MNATERFFLRIKGTPLELMVALQLSYLTSRFHHDEMMRTLSSPVKTAMIGKLFKIKKCKKITWKALSATTYWVSVTSEEPPDSRGMGCERKCSNMSKTDWNQRCWTRHWPSLLIVSRRCCMESKIYDGNHSEQSMSRHYFSPSLEIKSENKFAFTRFTLTDKENSMSYCSFLKN